MSNDNDAVFTVTELCRRWKYTRKVVLASIHTGKLAAFRLGDRAYRISLTEVLRYEAERAVPDAA